jgi:zinc/manganese transport system substrate-binding protein
MHVSKRVILMAVVVWVCSAHPSLTAEKLNVVASFSILGDLAARIGGDRVEVNTIVGPDSDAHVYEPKPDDAKAVAAAKVVIVNGLGFEGWLEKLTQASGYQGPVVTASEGVVTRKMVVKGDADHDHGEFDPHGWQSVPNAKIYVENIARGLCAADAEGCESYKGNATAYVKELDALDAEIKRDVAAIPEAKRLVITSHDAFGYFAREYGVKFLAPEGVSTESEASAQNVAMLIRQIRETKASALFIENMADPRLIRQIAYEAGLKMGPPLYSDALSAQGGPASTYVDMMRHNAKLLTQSMSGS